MKSLQLKNMCQDRCILKRFVSNKWSSNKDSWDELTSIKSFIRGFFSSGGMGAVPSGGG
jgi:hypothetical protein